MTIWYYRIRPWAARLEALAVGWRGEIAGVPVWVWVRDDWVEERWRLGEKGFVGLEGSIGAEIGKREKLCRKLLAKWWTRREDVRTTLLSARPDRNPELDPRKWVWYRTVLTEIHGKTLGYPSPRAYFFYFTRTVLVLVTWTQSN